MSDRVKCNDYEGGGVKAMLVISCRLELKRAYLGPNVPFKISFPKPIELFVNYVQLSYVNLGRIIYIRIRIVQILLNSRIL